MRALATRSWSCATAAWWSTGRADEIFAHPREPYTRALHGRGRFRARARRRERGAELIVASDREAAGDSVKNVRIGAGLGFYGDSWRPVRTSIEQGGVQYIASDHLAELTLAILQKDRQKDPAAGYTRDLVPMLCDLWPLAAPRGSSSC